MRYELPNQDLETSFLSAYKRTCEPPWTPEESKAFAIERMLMLIHGATYWTTRWTENAVKEELSRFRKYWQELEATL